MKRSAIERGMITLRMDGQERSLSFPLHSFIQH
jgi:hypothetical protein